MRAGKSCAVTLKTKRPSWADNPGLVVDTLARTFSAQSVA